MAGNRHRFYFDYISPYAYLAAMQLEQIEQRHDTTFELIPTLFAGLLGHHGQLGPAEIPSKRNYVFRDAMRCAAIAGISFTAPASHPFNPLNALRVSQRSVAGDAQRQVFYALWSASWGGGRELGDDQSLIAILNQAGLDGDDLLARAKAPESKAELRKATEDAIAAGVFGVPTFMIDDEPFWGADRLEHVHLALAGNDPLDEAQWAAVRDLPSTAQRKR